ncbi:MAG: hypothetical protein ABI233_00055, partial [Chthoniobacterales bacterium]
MDSVAEPELDPTAAAPAPETPPELSSFVSRHIGPNDEEIGQMLETIGFENLANFIDATVPKDIRLTTALDLPAGKSEQE